MPDGIYGPHLLQRALDFGGALRGACRIPRRLAVLHN
jgi:hypothetical protein